MSIENKISIVVINSHGFKLSERLCDKLNADIFAFSKMKIDSIGDDNTVTFFDDTKEIFKYLFENYSAIVAIMAQGIVVRMIAPLIKSKYKDPAVVVCDEVGRFAISALSGHEGGANELTYIVSSITGAEPVVTTATDANKLYILGIGCRKNTDKEKIIYAIKNACEKIGITIADLRLIASCWHKENEIGLLEAGKELGIYLRFLPKFLYENSLYVFNETTAKKYLQIPAVAEPSAILSAKNPKIILPKTIYDDVTISIVKENTIIGENK